MSRVVYCRSCNEEIEPVEELDLTYKTEDGKYHAKLDCDEVETEYAK